MAKKILGKIFNVICVLIIVFALFILFCVVTTPAGQQPNAFGYYLFRVLTGSMEPRLRANDMVFIVKTNPEDYKVGDIALYQDGSTLVIHRIISIDDVEDGDSTKRMVTLKGDANNASDTPISIKNLKGRLKFSIPFVGLLVRGIKSTIGVILILALAFFLFHRSWQKEKEAGDAELDKIKDEIRQLKDDVDSGGNTVDAIKAEI